MAMIQPNKHYTYADYLAWDDEARYELIDGVMYMTSPAPSPIHQSVSGGIFGQLYNFLHGKPCKVYHAPFDVRLNASAGDDTVVQPDLLVVCDKTKIDARGCVGAPDLMIEILSPSTARHDKLLKFNAYLRAGVREYWIVDPDIKTVTVHILKDSEYTTKAYADSDTVPVRVLEGCQINLPDVFAE